MVQMLIVFRNRRVFLKIMMVRLALNLDSLPYCIRYMIDFLSLIVTSLYLLLSAAWSKWGWVGGGKTSVFCPHQVE